MGSKPYTRVVRTIGASVLGVFAMLVLLDFINSGTGFAGCTATAAFGWLIPLLSGAIVAVIAWMLIEGGRDGSSESSESTPESTTCMHCESTILQEWKLCPYCGQLRECDMRIDPRASRRELG